MTPAVIALIVVIVVVFLWEETNIARAEQRFELWPYGVHYRHQWYRLVTSTFLHAGWEHIILNMITLAIVGPAVEAEIGAVRFLAVYLLSAVGGSVAFEILANPASTAVGASGAIFGVMGAYYVLARLRRWDVQTISALLVINIIYSFAVPGIGWQAHLGGLIAGGAVCLGLVATPRSWGPRPSELVQVVQGAAVVIASVAILALLAMVPVGHVNV
jgi:membrane associated rhomboid family serine protease